MRIFRTAGVFGLAVVFSLAMLVFLAACFFPAQSQPRRDRAPELSAGVFSRMTLCRELMVVYLSFAMLFVVLWRILGQIDQLRRRDAYRFSLELEQDGA